MKLSPEDAQRVRVAKTRLNILLDEYQAEHDLSDFDMLDAVLRWQASVVRAMRRADLGAEAPPTEDS